MCAVLPQASAELLTNAPKMLRRISDSGGLYLVSRHNVVSRHIQDFCCRLHQEACLQKVAIRIRLEIFASAKNLAPPTRLRIDSPQFLQDAHSLRNRAKGMPLRSQQHRWPTIESAMPLFSQWASARKNILHSNWCSSEQRRLSVPRRRLFIPNLNCEPNLPKIEHRIRNYCVQCLKKYTLDSTGSSQQRRA
jgi:hypothetical protein